MAISRASGVGSGVQHHLLGHAGQLPVLLVGRARPGQVQRPVDQGVATGCGKGQSDGHLAQRDPAHGAAVLAGRTHRIRRRLLIGGLISTASPSSRWLTAQAAAISRTCCSSQTARDSRCCSRCGPECPAASAMLQQL